MFGEPITASCTLTVRRTARLSGWTGDDSEVLAHAESLLDTARSIDSDYPSIYETTFQLLVQRREYDEALRMIEMAVALEPNNAEYRRRLGNAYRRMGEHKEAIRIVKEAMRLNPYYPYYYPGNLCQAYMLDGQYEKALEACKQAVSISPNSGGAHRRLALAYTFLGRMDEAKFQAQELLRLQPNFTISRYAEGQAYRDPADIKILADGLRLLGLPEGE